MSSPFEVLGIDRDADDDAIRRAYRRRVKEAHPDQGGSASEFQAVRAAYEQLRDGGQGADPGRPGDARGGPGHPTGPEPGPEAPDVEPARVEYLNYEVLDDHGWALDDDALFETAADADLDPADYGRFEVRPYESLLEAAENRGFAWPFACRGGACANCAVRVVKGELSQPVDTILPSEMARRGIRLSCNGMVLSDELKVVFNLKHRPDLADFRLPPDPFEIAHGDD